MSLKKFILHRIIPLPDIDSFDSYVFVAPHPDDAEVGAGATMAKLAEQGKRITLIIATDGRYGSESADYDREALALKRREEQEASSRLLGLRRKGSGESARRRICKAEASGYILSRSAIAYRMSRRSSQSRQSRAQCGPYVRQRPYRSRLSRRNARNRRHDSDVLHRRTE